MRRINIVVALGAALAMSGAVLSAQGTAVPAARAFAVTSAPINAPDLVDADLTIDSMTRSGALELVSANPDRQLPGHRHEYLRQVHRGVPVHGAGLARQRQDGATISVFGTVYDEIDIDSVPTLSAEAALDRIEAVAGAPPATSEAPRLAILPTELGELVLTWSAPMRDFHTWFIDAHSGQPVKRVEHLYTESAVGFGRGITGAPQKVSAWHTGVGYQAWDRLRPAEIVTMDGRGELVDRVALFFPTPAWLEAVAWDDDNEWANASITDAHAHLGMTYDYLAQHQDWHGIDGEDGRILAIANLTGYYNASYLRPPFGPQGSGLMSFGVSRDDVPLVTVDIVGHELQHGVTNEAVRARTGLPVIGRQTFALGPSSLTVEGETIRCGDYHTFPAIPLLREEEKYAYMCLDEDFRTTTSRNGRFAMWMYEGGALHEAYSDIIGTAVEFSVHPPGEGLLHADYRVGEDIGRVIRRLDAPHSLDLGSGYTLPDSINQAFRFVGVLVPIGRYTTIRYTRWGMRGNRPFRLSSDGYNGVHWNSTILSHAFYLAIEGGTHSSGATVTGVGGANRHLVEQAFFRGLADLAPPSITFRIMGSLIRQSAIDLHGSGSAAFVAIHEALTAVGL